jgi:hypothetical protein
VQKKRTSSIASFRITKPAYKVKEKVEFLRYL